MSDRGPLTDPASEPQSPIQQQSSYIEYSTLQYIRVLNSAGTSTWYIGIIITDVTRNVPSYDVHYAKELDVEGFDITWRGS